MDLSVHWVEIPLSEDQQDIWDVFPRDRGAEWYVIDSPLDLRPGADLPKVVYRRGEKVAVPLFPYLTAEDPGCVIGYAFQLGALAALSRGLARPPAALHLSIGKPLQRVTYDDGTVGWRIYLGCAFREHREGV